MEHLFESSPTIQVAPNLDSINSTAAIWTGIKQYSWMKTIPPKAPDNVVLNASSAAVSDASEHITIATKKRKKTETPSRKKAKTSTVGDDESSSTIQLDPDEQSHKKPKTKSKAKTPKTSTTKTKKATQNTDDLRTNAEQEVLELSSGAALEIPQDTPNKKKRAKTSEAEDNEQEYPCPVEGCEKVFDRKGTLNRHMASHSDDRNFPCDLCDKAFKLKGELVRHYKSHTSKQFECSHPGCGRKFSFECNLERHVFTVHMGVKKFECPQCNKVFGQPTDLERHSLVHSGERPFSCKWCDKKFKQLAHLQNHEKRKHDPTKVSEQEFLEAVLKEGGNPDPNSETKPETESEAKPEPKSEAKPETKPETKAKVPSRKKKKQAISEEQEQESSESEKEATNAPTRRSSRAAAKNALYKFDFSDSEIDE